ncbi:MAG: cation:H+ antiporter [Paraglaciecola psychrophila]|jgi:cation:H+ antiporter
MITAILAIIIGFIGLIWSADRFVTGAAGIARNLGMAPITIGLTVVALGTSAPEILVAISAALEDASELAVGNAIGSNLANVGMVLGITALVAPIPIRFGLLKREFPLLIGATLGAGLLLYDNELSVIDGLLLLTGLAAIFYYLVTCQAHLPNEEQEADLEQIPDISNRSAWKLFFIGLVLLMISSHVLVAGAKDIASALGVSELVIGLTVVAIGTSLPELAATVASALKGHHDIALGNIVGSNLFNLLAVMSMPALINPPTLDSDVFTRDYAAMTAITLLLAAIALCHKLWANRHMDSPTSGCTTSTIGRLEGLLLLLAYGLYFTVLF